METSEIGFLHRSFRADSENALWLCGISGIMVLVSGFEYD